MRCYKVRGAIPVKKAKRKKRKKSSKALRTLRAANLKAFGEALELAQFPSEMWFKERYARHLHKKDQFNIPLGQYIPDVQNAQFKYVIEIDGSIHNTPAQKKKDIKKDRYFYAWGYQVIRIKAYDEQSFLEGLRTIVDIRLKTG